MRRVLFIIMLLPLFAFSQEKVTGIVLEIINGKEVPVGGANVFWADSQI